jgi:peptidoglycan hydrolase-like protein with peptidoglycan-binding domain
LLLPAAVFALVATGAYSTPQSNSKAPAKPPASAAPKNSAPAKKSATATAPRTGSRKRVTPAARSKPGQAAPTPDRIREIQQALAERGYLTPVDGNWSKDSEAAMAKFQADQNLDGKGKLNSLSLIALGLGPKHDSNPGPAAPPAQKD